MKKELEDANYISFATYRKNGNAVATPVWFAQNGNALYLFSAGNAGKVKRLRNFSRSKLAPCDVKGKVLGDWVEAESFLCNSPEQEKYAYKQLLKKYGWQMRALNVLSWIGGNLNKRAFIEVNLKPTE